MGPAGESGAGRGGPSPAVFIKRMAGVFLGCLLGLFLSHLPTLCTKDASFFCWGRRGAEALPFPLVALTEAR